MALRLMIWATYVLDFMFFAGLIGCAFAIIISWISILKDGLTED